MPDTTAYALVSTLMHDVGKVYASALKPLELTPAQGAVLNALYVRNGQTVQELKSVPRLGIDLSGLHSIVTLLEDKRLVYRDYSVRPQRIRLTVQGHALREQVVAAMQEAEAAAAPILRVWIDTNAPEDALAVL
jgi:DNA-binding MarR family transcriptional regulator